MNLIESVRDLFGALRNKHDATLAYLVEAAVSGRDEVKPAQVVETLGRLGLGFGDLEAAVKAEANRRALRDRMEAGRLAAAESAGIPARTKALAEEYRREREAVEARYAPRFGELRERSKLLDAAKRKGDEAERELRRLAPAETHERFREICGQRRAVAGRAESLRESRASVRHSARLREDAIARAEEGPRKEEQLAEAARLASRLEGIEAKLAGLAAEDARLAAEAEAAFASMIDDD